MDLTERHEQSFYNFAHKVHSKGAGLFDDLMQWVEKFVSFLRDGFAQAVDLEFLLPEDEAGRQVIFSEVDQLIQHHYRLKVAHEERMRRRMLNDQTLKEEEAVNGLLQDLKIGQLKEDFEGVDDPEDSDSDQESEVAPSPGKNNGESSQQLATSRRNVHEPVLVHLPALRPLFVEVIRPLLEQALMEDET